MDRIYIKTNELDYLTKLRIDKIMQDLDYDLQDFISVDLLVNMVCEIYIKYYNLEKNYESLINYIDGKRSKNNE